MAASVDGSFEDGVAKEQEYGAVLFMSGQARALQYAFFAQRAASKVKIMFFYILIAIRNSKLGGPLFLNLKFCDLTSLFLKIIAYIPILLMSVHKIA